MRWIAAVLLVLYSVFVARLTLADPSSGQPVFSLADHWATVLSGGRLDWAETEVLANIALFAPAGLLLAIVLQRPLLAAVLCVVASACIELAQQRWFPTRVPTVADVEHNSLGAALGVAVAWVALPARR
ncbi:VanZ family protein [Nocardioides humilatus]|uniref:VanZ family protein n=1 Tax=Nocardioides humilatus TaxID=2607660 RepID=A0A5B1L5R5_9ACTN|nr:VanZ family protein [Nocardioides humilatus]KAA1415855.1 VanZ family protein [Nocardioides humilatus]